MSSILTNTGAMVAIQTIKTTSAKLNAAQSEISTGRSINSSKDNAAIWAISKVMESDVVAFKSISDSLGLGSATVAVAREAAETVTNLLTEVKGKIVAAQEKNVDRSKIQTDISSLRSQIESVVATAQFNGLNLVNGTQITVDVLSSLDRTATDIKASAITITAQDLSVGGYVAKNVLGGSTGVSAAGDTAGFTLDTATGTGTIEIDGSAVPFVAGDKVSITISGRTASYTVSATDMASTSSSDLVAVGLKNAVEALGISGLTVDYDSSNPGALAFTNAGTADLTVTAQFKNAGSGVLSPISSIDVTTDAGAAAAMANIESLLQISINAAAAFGSVEKRIEIQGNFISKLSDSMTSGVGTLVDADMEEASARLSALQVQQQLGIQALSIANEHPQNLLSLFR